MFPGKHEGWSSPCIVALLQMTALKAPQWTDWWQSCCLCWCDVGMANFLLSHPLLLEAVVCWWSLQAGVHILLFLCRCPTSGVLRGPGTSWRQHLPVHCHSCPHHPPVPPFGVFMCCPAGLNPCFWGCSFPGSHQQTIASSFSCSSNSSAGAYMLLQFQLCNLPDFSRIFYFSFVLCLFLCPFGAVKRPWISSVARRKWKFWKPWATDVKIKGSSWSWLPWLVQVRETSKYEVTVTVGTNASEIWDQSEGTLGPLKCSLSAVCHSCTSESLQAARAWLKRSVRLFVCAVMLQMPSTVAYIYV